MSAEDSGAVALLCTELGYPSKTADLRRRFSDLLSRTDNGIFVVASERAEIILGWVHVYGVRLLESEGYAEIGGIVVSKEYRSRGIGRTLLRAAEIWAIGVGYGEVRLRSGLHRDDAHLFYVAVGYEQSKASYLFKRRVSEL